MTNKNEFPLVIKDFISAVNSHDGKAFINAFADDALVNDASRNFWGREAIKKWSDEEMIKAKVTFDPDEVMEHHGGYMITALTNGGIYFNPEMSGNNVHIINSITELHRRVMMAAG